MLDEPGADPSVLESRKDSQGRQDHDVDYPAWCVEAACAQQDMSDHLMVNRGNEGHRCQRSLCGAQGVHQGSDTLVIGESSQMEVAHGLMVVAHLWPDQQLGTV